MYELGRNRSVLVLLLGASLVLNSCKEAPRWAKAGPLFSAESAAPAKAVVYVYWPREMRGRVRQVFISSCDNFEPTAVLPGGYTPFVVEPGSSCFQAEATWYFANDRGSLGEDLGRVKIRSEPGHSIFLRVEPRKWLLDHHNVLRRMAPAVAEPEIRTCRRSVPLSFEEIAARG